MNIVGYHMYCIYVNYVLVKLSFTTCLYTCIYFVSQLYLPFLNKDFQNNEQ